MPRPFHVLTRDLDRLHPVEVTEEDRQVRLLETEDFLNEPTVEVDTLYDVAYGAVGPGAIAGSGF